MTSAQSTGHLYIIEGMMTQYQHKNVLEQRLITQLKGWFQMETSYLCMMKLWSIKLYLWSNFWMKKKLKNTSMAWKHSRYEPNREFLGYCKEKIKEMHHHLQEWSDRKTHPNLTPWQWNTNCQKLIQSMPGRIEYLIKNKGMHIKY